MYYSLRKEGKVFVSSDNDVTKQKDTDTILEAAVNMIEFNTVMTKKGDGNSFAAAIRGIDSSLCYCGFIH